LKLQASVPFQGFFSGCGAVSFESVPAMNPLFGLGIEVGLRRSNLVVVVEKPFQFPLCKQFLQ
jgi:hypothetical protein